MESILRVLHVDASSGFYRMERFLVGEFFGPADLGLFLSTQFRSFNFGTGLLCGSQIPGTDQLVFSGHSPSWKNFHLGSLGSGGAVFDNLGLTLVSIRNRAATPSAIYLNRIHAEEIEVEMRPLDIDTIWKNGRQGVFGMVDVACDLFSHRFSEQMGVLAVGPASAQTDMGAITSAFVKDEQVVSCSSGAISGGLGTKLLREHGVGLVVFGGTNADKDYENKLVTNQWFQTREYKKKVKEEFERDGRQKELATLCSKKPEFIPFSEHYPELIAFNYQSIFLEHEKRRAMHRQFVVDNYCGQIAPVGGCDAPLGASEALEYQVFGPLIGVFDSKAASRVTDHAKSLGFDALSISGVLAWLMECTAKELLEPSELGVSTNARWQMDAKSLQTDSAHNADLAVELIDSIVEKRGRVDLQDGARRFAYRLFKAKGNRDILDRFVYCGNGRQGWAIPMPKWNLSALSPSPIVAGPYLYDESVQMDPRTLGQKNAKTFKRRILLDNAGVSNTEEGGELILELVGKMFGQKDRFVEAANGTASRIFSRNASVTWESKRNIDFVDRRLALQKELGAKDDSLEHWTGRFEQDKNAAAFDLWFEIQKGMASVLTPFFS